MILRKGKERSILATGVLLTALILGGCTSIKYSYDTGASSSGLKTYTWAPASGIYGGQDSVLEANVQAIADQSFGDVKHAVEGLLSNFPKK